MPSTSAIHSKSRMLAMKLRESIQRGEWLEGAQLPGMRELASRLGSSVPTVQSALRILEGEGLVECHPRRGAFVRASPFAGASRSVSTQSAREVLLFADYDDECPSDDWVERIFFATRRTLFERGCQVRLASPYGDGRLPIAQTMLQQIDSLRDQIDGAIFLGARSLAPLVERLDARGFPWVSIRPINEGSRRNCVTADLLVATQMLGQWLAQQGMDRVLILTSDLSEFISMTDMVSGLLRGYLVERSTTDGVKVCRCRSIKEKAGHEVVRDYLERHDPPQLIFTIGDYLAIGAMRACRERGIAVPEQVKVIGCTGLDVAEHVSPALTVLQQPMEAMGQAAARMLLAMIEQGHREHAGYSIPPRMIWRESFPLPTGEVGQRIEAVWSAYLAQRQEGAEMYEQAAVSS